jgi:hypothetical protein
MDTYQHANGLETEAEMPTDLLAGLLMELAHAPDAVAARPERVPLKVYGVMAVTTLSTFATLVSGYQMLFAHHPFA